MFVPTFRRTLPILGIILLVSLTPDRFEAQGTGPYQELYGRGIRAIYEQHLPHDAIRLFQQAHQVDPRQWPAPFMVGYIYRSDLKQPAAAAAYLEKAAALGPESPLPLNELTATYAELGRFVQALDTGKAALALYESKGEAPSDWLRNHVAWLHFKQGDVAAALQTATPGNGLFKLLRPKEITIRWPVSLAAVFRKWGVGSEEKVAITVPVDRPYQTLVSADVLVSEGFISTEKLEARGNRFLVLSRSAGAWPEQATLVFRVHQTIVGELPGRKGQFAAANEDDPNFEFAVYDGGGYFSQSDARLVDLVARTSAAASTEGEKADLLLRHLRANFRYGARTADRNILEIFQSGSGDCGYYAVVAMGFLRARRIPVRFLYGFNAVYNPPLPHAVIEMYEAGRDRWVPHDPQADDYFGIINPGFVAFTAYPPDASDPRSWNPQTAGGIRYVDTMNFFWSDSGIARRQQIAVRDLDVPARSLARKRSLRPPSGAEERTVGVRGQRLPPPAAAPSPRPGGPPPFAGKPVRNRS